MEQGRRQIAAFLEGLSDEQMLATRDAAGWNLRDHVTHLAAWADGIAALLRREDRWAAMGLAMANPEGDEPDYEWINAQIAARHQALPPGEARAWLLAAHERVRQAVEALPEAELGRPYERFVAPFTGEWGQPVAEYVLGNTEDHYDEHMGWMRAMEG
jgi:uncharacterized damage-inducible protein DinB